MPCTQFSFNVVRVGARPHRSHAESARIEAPKAIRGAEGGRCVRENVSLPLGEGLGEGCAPPRKFLNFLSEDRVWCTLEHCLCVGDTYTILILKLLPDSSPVSYTHLTLPTIYSV